MCFKENRQPGWSWTASAAEGAHHSTVATPAAVYALYSCRNVDCWCFQVPRQHNANKMCLQNFVSPQHFSSTRSSLCPGLIQSWCVSVRSSWWTSLPSPKKNGLTLGWGLGSSFLRWWWWRSPRMPTAPERWDPAMPRSELWIIPFWGDLLSQWIRGLGLGYPMLPGRWWSDKSVANAWQLLICSHFWGGRNWRSTELNHEPTNPFRGERSELEVKGLEYFGLHWSSGNYTSKPQAQICLSVPSNLIWIS